MSLVESTPYLDDEWRITERTGDRTGDCLHKRRITINTSCASVREVRGEEMTKRKKISARNDQHEEGIGMDNMVATAGNKEKKNESRRLQ
jgi:hypothetical protein